MWNRTTRVKARLHEALTTIWHHRHGYVTAFKGRHIIGRDMSVIEGVYPGGGMRECLVVSETDGKLQRFYESVVNNASLSVHFGHFKKPKNILLLVGFLVEQCFGEQEPNLAKKVETFCQTNGYQFDRKVDLTVFMNAHLGVCRHRALLVAYVLEKLIQDGKLKGRVSVDRNELPNLGAHAWVRFTDEASGDVWIIDATLYYIGLLPTTHPQPWNYARPEDLPPSTPETLPVRAKEVKMSFKNYIPYIAAATIFTLVGGGVTWLTYPLWSDQYDLLTNVSACKSALETERGKGFDVEAAKRKQETAEEALTAKQAELVAALATIATLEAELDSDGDKIHDKVDRCPNSPTPTGVTSWAGVNSYGCTEFEAGMSCNVSSPRLPGQFEQYIWSDCPLSDEIDVDFTCTAHLDPVAGFVDIEECHSTPFNWVDGPDGKVKSYGG